MVDNELRNWVYLRIADKMRTQEYAMMRMLGYSSIEASLHVMTIHDDFRRMCQCMAADRAAK